MHMQISEPDEVDNKLNELIRHQTRWIKRQISRHETKKDKNPSPIIRNYTRSEGPSLWRITAIFVEGMGKGFFFIYFFIEDVVLSLA